MANSFNNHKRLFRFLAIIIICLLIVRDIPSTVKADIASANGRMLSAPWGTSPLADVRENDGGYEVTDDPADILSRSRIFQEKSRFIYLALRIKEALELDISAETLERMMLEDGMEMGDLVEIKKAKGSYTLLFSDDSAGEPVELKYFLERGVVGERTGRIIQNIEGVMVACANVGGTIEPRQELSEGPENAIDSETLLPSGDERFFSSSLPDSGLAEQVVEKAHGDNKKAFLDWFTMEQAVLISLIYLAATFDPTTVLLKMATNVIPVLLLSVAFHEAIHWLQLKMFTKGHKIGHKFKVNKEGVFLEIISANQSIPDKITLAGMVGSGTVSTVFSVASFFYGSSFLMLMAIINAVFAFSGRDLKELRKKATFRDAHNKFYKVFKKGTRDLLRKDSKPGIVLIGGYFASGKGFLARKIKAFLRRKLKRRVWVIGGDNWLLSEDKRPEFEDRAYPYHKYEYEIAKWKEMVKRASDGLPIFIPFYIATFRERLTISEVEFAEAMKYCARVKEDGYELINADFLKERPIAELLPPEYLRAFFRRVRESWDQEPEKEKKIIRQLTRMLKRPLKKFLINPNSQIYVDVKTRDLLERMPVDKNDVLIMEFEQALRDDEIARMADVKAFVEAPFMHRREYFVERRNRGERYADLTAEEAEHKMRSLYGKEDLIVTQKADIDILVQNAEYLEARILDEKMRPWWMRSDRGKGCAYKGETDKTKEKDNKEKVIQKEIKGAVKAAEKKNTGRARKKKPQKTASPSKSKTQPSDEWTAQFFVESLKVRAHRAAKKKEDILVAIDTSWIPEIQKPVIQEMISSLKRLSREKWAANIVFISGKGERLPGLIKETREKERRNIPCANVIVLGAGNVLKSEEFDYLREAPDLRQRAFFAEIELAPDFPETGYLRLFELVTDAVGRAFRTGEREHKFLLESRPFDLEEELKKSYRRQVKHILRMA